LETTESIVAARAKGSRAPCRRANVAKLGKTPWFNPLIGRTPADCGSEDRRLYLSRARGGVAGLAETRPIVIRVSKPSTNESPPAPLPRVLLVEDNAVSLLVAQAMLEAARCSLTCATAGPEAAARLRTERFDLVFMDCQMPELDGYAVTRLLREHEATHGLPRTPVVALTANTLQDDRQRCLDAGMDDYIAKPFRRAQLVAMIERYCGRRA
jgi:CheY-like chemotaxis protein